MRSPLAAEFVSSGTRIGGESLEGELERVNRISDSRVIEHDGYNFQDEPFQPSDLSPGSDLGDWIC